MSITQAEGKIPLLPTPGYSGPHWNRVDFGLVAGLVLLGLALRLPGLNQGLWVDEIDSLVKFMRLPPMDIVYSAGYKNNHVLYSLSTHYSIAWFGESIWALRLPALLFGVAAIPAVYLLGRQITSRSEAFLAALFMAAGYHFVWYSQSARGYTGLLLGALLTTVLFIRLVTAASPPKRIVIGYVVVAALTVWLHLTAVFLLFTHGLIWLVLTVKLAAARRLTATAPTLVALLLAGLLTLALYIPLFVEQTPQHFEATEVVLRVSDAPGPAEWTLAEFTIGLERSMPGGWPVILAVIAVLLAGIVSYSRQGSFYIALLLLPAVVAVAYISTRGNLLFPRFLFGFAGFFLLIGVRGGFTLAGLALPFLTRRAVLYIGIVFALAAASMVPAAWKPKQDYVAAVQFLQQNHQPGDALVCVGATPTALTKFFGLSCESVTFMADLDRIESQHKRTWLVYTLRRFSIKQLTEIKAAIDAPSRYRLVREFEGSLRGGTITVLLHEKADPVPVTRAESPHLMLNSERIRSRFGSYGADVLEQDAQFRVSSLYSLATNAKITRTLAVVAYAQDIPQQALTQHKAIVNSGSIGEVFKQAGWNIEKQNLHFGSIAASAEYAGVYALMGLADPELLAVHVYDLWLSKNAQEFRYATIVEIHHPDYLDAESMKAQYGEEYQGLQASSPYVEEVLDQVVGKLRRLPQTSPASSPGLAPAPPTIIPDQRATAAVIPARRSRVWNPVSLLRAQLDSRSLLRKSWNDGGSGCAQILE